MGGLAESSTELAYLPVDEVHPNPRQPRRRFEPEAHRSLTSCAAGDRRCQAQAGDGAVKQRPVLRPDRHQDVLDPRVLGERGDGVAQNIGIP